MIIAILSRHSLPVAAIAAIAAIAADAAAPSPLTHADKGGLEGSQSLLLFCPNLWPQP